MSNSRVVFAAQRERAFRKWAWTVCGDSPSSRAASASERAVRITWITRNSAGVQSLPNGATVSGSLMRRGRAGSRLVL
jgi:hypothetical protein